MKNYSITKYKTVDESIYNEWISLYDIGNVYNGKKLTVEDYLQVEDAYVYAIILVLNYMDIKNLNVKNVFRWMDLRSTFKEDILSRPYSDKLYSDKMIKFYYNVHDVDIIDLTQVGYLIRLKLREDIAGEIFVPYRFKLFIGYDYLMSVSTSKSLENIFYKIEELGLYIYELGNI